MLIDYFLPLNQLACRPRPFSIFYGLEWTFTFFFFFAVCQNSSPLFLDLHLLCHAVAAVIILAAVIGLGWTSCPCWANDKIPSILSGVRKLWDVGPGASESLISCHWQGLGVIPCSGSDNNFSARY